MRKFGIRRVRMHSIEKRFRVEGLACYINFAEDIGIVRT